MNYKKTLILSVLIWSVGHIVMAASVQSQLALAKSYLAAIQTLIQKVKTLQQNETPADQSSISGALNQLQGYATDVQSQINVINNLPPGMMAGQKAVDNAGQAAYDLNFANDVYVTLTSSVPDPNFSAPDSTDVVTGQIFTSYQNAQNLISTASNKANITVVNPVLGK